MNTDIEWFEKHRQRAIDEFPILKDARLGCHIWLFTTRMSWYNGNKQHGKFWQDAGFEPLSEASKRLVCVHGDLHRGNIICDNNEKIYLIDYEFVAPQWAVNDIAYIFSISQFGCHSYKGKFEFCKMYLEEIGLPSDDDEVDLDEYEENDELESEDDELDEYEEDEQEDEDKQEEDEDNQEEDEYKQEEKEKD